MVVYASNWNAKGEIARRRRQDMAAQVTRMEALRHRAEAASNKSRAVFERRGQLLPRERIGLLLDPGKPFLPLCAFAGYGQDRGDTAQSIPGAAILAGIGWISGVRCMIVANDSGIDAGAIQPMGLEKMLRLQEIALQNKLPFVHLVESAGANLMNYRVDVFVYAGAMFRNLARLSAAGIPVVTIQHGSGTAGGAYMPGLSDVVVMVRNRSRAFLAGPPLLLAATGEVATEEELGGAEMHATVSGLGEYLAEDDRHAIGIAREIMANLGWPKISGASADDAGKPVRPPRFDLDDMLTLMPSSLREPVDMREIMARLVDDSDLLEFKPAYGPQTLCVQARIDGRPVGFISNNGPIDVAGANKATHFIQRQCQLGAPLIYLQNTTGYMVGKESEQGGMIKHGSKMIQAVTNATVPQITIQCGGSFGAGNYGMCGRAYQPRFLFAWPSARTAVMGGEQAARTMQQVTEAANARKGRASDPVAAKAQFDKIVDMFESQADVFYTSGLMLDDGVIDPRDTREVLAMCLSICAEAERRETRPMQFSVGRM